MHREGADKAERCFKLALSYDANNADALFDLGALCELKGDYIGAYQWYQRAQTIYPKDAQISSAFQYVSTQIPSQSDRPKISVVPHSRPLHGIDLGCPVCGALNGTPLRAATPLLEQLAKQP